MKNYLPTIIITGASGFVGRHFIDALKDKFRIFAIARRSQKEADIPFHVNINWIQWDIGNEENLKDVVSVIRNEGSADFCLHLAGFYDFEYDRNPEYKRTNIDGTKHVLELSKYTGVKRFLFASSLAACNFPKQGEKITEKTPADADFEYAITKKAGEEMVKNYSIRFPCSVIRFAAVFSDWCEYAPLYKFLETWLSKSWNAKILGGKGDSAVSYIHIYDLIKMVMIIIRKTKSLPRYDVYNASPMGCTNHKELFQIATRDYYGHSVKPFHMPKAIALPGVIARDLLGKAGVINPPFEKPWMIKYLDLKLDIDTSYTRKALDWDITPRYHINRRLLFLLVNMKSHSNEWHMKNEAALKHASSRPNLIIYEEMMHVRKKLLKDIANHICSLERKDTFPNYQLMNVSELQNYLSTLYHLLLASVRSGDRSLMIKYIDDIAIQRFSKGFEPAEICEVLNVFKESILSELLFKKEMLNLKQEIYDYLGLTIQVAQDEIEDVYESINDKLPGRIIPDIGITPDQQKRQEMIRQLSDFYQQFPSG